MAAEPVKKASPDFAKRLTQKVGPLPVWAWAASILVIAYAYSRNRSSKQAAASTGSTSPTAADQMSGLTSDGGLMGSGAAGAGAGFGSGMANPNAPLPYDSSIPYDFNPWSYQNGTTTATGTTNVPATATGTTGPTDNGGYVATSSGTAAFTQPGPGGIPLQVYGTVAPTTAQTAATGTPGSALSGPPAPAILSAVPNGATSVKVLPSGAVTYVTGSGATVEKAPGMTPYVIKAAPAAAAPKPAPKPASAAIPNQASSALRKIGI
ncbi:unannotated protein [freshwater metagenome]|uniref:Unannotated protein n=1 Tax=freshwater metagenome TaxID=449393 RepID=A0A6J5Z255_9ZZZZ|nr:hypothetical protein [Actinomycetota bacterium]